MDRITRRAYAKINLGLDVIKRRPDGYHEVKMIMQTVGIYDVLTFFRKKKRDGSPSITISMDNGELPSGEGNLVYKAAALTMEAFGIREGVGLFMTSSPRLIFAYALRVIRSITVHPFCIHNT